MVAVREPRPSPFALLTARQPYPYPPPFAPGSFLTVGCISHYYSGSLPSLLGVVGNKVPLISCEYLSVMVLSCDTFHYSPYVTLQGHVVMCHLSVTVTFDVSHDTPLNL